MTRFANSCAQNCQANVNSEFFVERVMSPSLTGNNPKTVQKYEWNFYTPPPLDRFDKVQICSELYLISIPSLERWTEFGVHCIFVKQSANISLVPLGQVSLLVARSLVARRKRSTRCVPFYESSPCAVSPSAAEESQHRICCVASSVSSALHPNFNDQFHCCRTPMPSQAPESAASNSASPLLSAIVDRFLLDAVIGYQVCLAPMMQCHSR